MRPALAAGDARQTEHRLHPLLIGALIGLGLIEHDRSRISAQCLPDAGLRGVASDDQTHVT